MANEAILRDRLDHPIDFTIADGTGIEKGTLLKMSDARTAAASDGSGDMLAGIAAREKVASDGRTQLAVFRRGIFDMVASGAIAVGQAVMSQGGSNEVCKAANTASGAAVLGHALEAAANNETFQVYVDISGGAN